MKNMRKFLKNTLAFLCTLAMLVTSIGISPVVTVFAESTGGRGNIQYRYYDTVEKTLPSEKTKKNYEEITDINKKKNILITVSKAAPTVNLTANVSENTVSKAVTLLAEITGAEL